MVVALKDPIKTPTLTTLVLLFERYYAAPIGRVRLWSTRLKNLGRPQPNGQPDLQNMLAAQPPSAQARSAPLWDAVLSKASELAAINGRIKELQKSRPKFATTLIMQPRPDGFVRPTHRYHRGEFLNPREEVQPATPNS